MLDMEKVEKGLIPARAAPPEGPLHAYGPDSG